MVVNSTGIEHKWDPSPIKEVLHVDLIAISTLSYLS